MRERLVIMIHARDGMKTRNRAALNCPDMRTYLPASISPLPPSLPLIPSHSSFHPYPSSTTTITLSELKPIDTLGLNIHFGPSPPALSITDTVNDTFAETTRAGIQFFPLILGQRGRWGCR